MSGRAQDGGTVAGHPASIRGAAAAAAGQGDADIGGDARLQRLRADEYCARRERHLLASKVALLAYKLQMNSHERHRRHLHHHHHHHQQQQPCQANCNTCARSVGRFRF